MRKYLLKPSHSCTLHIHEQLYFSLTLQYVFFDFCVRQVPELAHFVFKLLQDGDPLLLHACFNVLAVIIRHCPSFELTPQQIQLLLGFAEQDMSHTSKQATAFTLLKAILSRKFLLPGVYDTMKKVLTSD